MPRPALHTMVMEKQAQKDREDLEARYRLVFGGDAGRQVLADILRDLGVLQDLDPRDAALNVLRNYAETRLRKKVGKLNYLGAMGLLIGPQE